MILYYIYLYWKHSTCVTSSWTLANAHTHKHIRGIEEKRKKNNWTLLCAQINIAWLDSETADYQTVSHVFFAHLQVQLTQRHRTNKKNDKSTRNSLIGNKDHWNETRKWQQFSSLRLGRIANALHGPDCINQRCPTKCFDRLHHFTNRSGANIACMQRECCFIANSQIGPGHINCMARNIHKLRD